MLKIFRKNRDQEKQETVSRIVDNILHSSYEFNHVEQTEILNRVSINLLERKKEKRSQLIQEARELQKSMIEIKI